MKKPGLKRVPRKLVEPRRRVINLMNAISDLHHGDLLTVLDLYPPGEDFGLDDTFQWKEKEGKVIHIPGPTPPQRSLKSRMQTKEAYARILEEHLMEVMSAGQCELGSNYREGRKKELGGRIFCHDVDEEGNPPSRGHYQ